LEMQLKGLVYNREKDEFQKGGEPLANQEGVKSVIILLRAHLNHNNVLGVLDKKEAYALTKDVAHLINEQIYLNQIHWNVRINDWPLIVNIVRNQVFIFLTRPVGGGERQRLSKSYRFGESNNNRGTRNSFFANKQEDINYGHN